MIATCSAHPEIIPGYVEIVVKQHRKDSDSPHGWVPEDDLQSSVVEAAPFRRAVRLCRKKFAGVRMCRLTHVVVEICGSMLFSIKLLLRNESKTNIVKFDLVLTESRLWNTRHRLEEALHESEDIPKVKRKSATRRMSMIWPGCRWNEVEVTSVNGDDYSSQRDKSFRYDLM